MKHRASWNKLDNAAKMFAPTSSVMDPKVFRCSCELYENVDPALLQAALEETAWHLPYFCSTIKKGLFWHYLEQCDIIPQVQRETRAPLSPLYHPDRHTLLFEVTYFQSRINLDIFHALSDGAGGFQFLQTLVICYLVRRYPETFAGRTPLLELDSLDGPHVQDGFSKYYTKVRLRREKSPPSYQLRGERFSGLRFGVTECLIPAAELLALSKAQSASLTELLSVFFIQAIHAGMTLSEERRPVVLSVPVNLRNYFPTPTIRNFFGIFLVRHDFVRSGGRFEDILFNVKAQFAQQLTPEALGERMRLFSTIENKMAAKLTPLVLKEPGLRLGNYLFDRSMTAGLSNLGEIKMPKGFSRFIRLFGVSSSTSKLDLCLCSYEEQMVLSFSSTLTSPEVQRNFVRALADNGIPVTVDSNFQTLSEEA